MSKNRTLAACFDLLAPVALALALSFWWSALGWDEEWQRAFFDRGTGEWAQGESPLWRAIYRFGTVPVLVVCAGSILALMAGFRWEIWRRLRRVAFFFLSLLVIGPGLIANLWMKETWGRPRPREIAEFGGREAFESVFGMDFAGEGKSFPCGHATMGFYFIGVWLLLRRARPAWAWAALVVALGWGSLIGYTRMVQGGHFATDVVWAAAVMWVTAGGLFYTLGLDRRVLDLPVAARGSERPAIPLWVKLAGGSALVGLVAGISLGTPYRDERHIRPHEASATHERFRGSVKIWLGDVEIVPGEVFSITGQAWGHGVPTSEIADHWEESTEPDGFWRFKYQQRNSGYLTEIRQQLRITIPWRRASNLKLDLGPGATRLRLSPVSDPVKIDLILRETDLAIDLEPGTTLWIQDAGALESVQLPEGVHAGEERPEGEAQYRVSVSGKTGGRIRFSSPPSG